MTEQEQKAFDQMREALESSSVCIQLMSDGPSRASWGDTLDIIDAAITAANAVSEPIGINGLTEAETSASMSVMGLSKPTVQPQAQGEAAKKYAENLCISMARKFYPEVTQFEPLDDLFGLLTQIDNMTTGLVRPQATEPAGYKLVPVEPTPAMLYAIQNDCDILPPRGKRIWAAMLAAAPEAKQ